MAMLHRNKFFIIFIFLVIFGCSQKKTERDSFLGSEISREYINFSIAKIGKINYFILRKQLEDSIQTWEENGLKGYIDRSAVDFSLDSLMCFNAELTKLITIRACRDLKNGTLDALAYYYGVKIKEKWYFFSGPTMYVPRKDLSNPTPFPQLHEIAMKEVFRGYLKKNKETGEWEINERFFERIEFQYQKWAYWDKNGRQINNSILSDDSLKKLYINRIVYDKYK